MSLIALLSLISASVVLLMSGCTTRSLSVRVNDAVSGQPIRGATVQIIYPSFNGATSTTDFSGSTKVSKRPKNGIYLVVAADGYESRTVHDCEDHIRHLRVVLEPVNTQTKAQPARAPDAR